MRRWWHVLFALALCSPMAGAIETISSLADFAALQTSQSAFMLLVYAPWCGHSRAFLPEYEKAAASIPKLVFAKADGTVADELATKLDVKGYPTLLFIRQGASQAEYRGDRRAAPVAQWAKSMLEPALPRLSTPAEVSNWVSKKSVALVLFAADYTSPEVEMLHGVAAAMSSDAGNPPCALSTASPSAAELGLPAALGTLQPPAFVAFSKHDEGHSVLLPSESEPLTHARMLRFAQAAALPAVLTYAAGQAEEAFFGAPVPLHLLFFHSIPLKPDVRDALASVGKELKGDAVLATVESDANSEMATFFDVAPSGAIATPALLGFSVANGTKFVHKGSFDAAAILTFARDVVAGKVPIHLRSAPEVPQSGPIIELVGANFAKVVMDQSKDVLVHFYSPACGHCKKLAPVMKSVAEAFAGDDEMVVASMDAVANDVPGLDIEGFPTLIIFTKGNKRGLEYDGSRDLHDIVQFIKDARAGINYVGGLKDELPGSREQDDELERDAKVEL